MSTKEKSRRKIIGTLERKIIKHGFTVGYNLYNGWLPLVVQTQSSYVSVTLLVVSQSKDGECVHQIKAKGSVCQMNPNSAPGELYRASEEIERGARLAEDINDMKLSYTNVFPKDIIGAVIPNKGTALEELLAKHYEFGAIRHNGKSEFSAQLSDGRLMVIDTEPIGPDEECDQIQIKLITIY